MNASATEGDEKEMADPGFFEILNTTRAIKRLKPDPVPGPDAPGDMDRQALAGVFIDHHHQLDRAAVIGSVEHKVPGPHMIAPLGAQPDAGTVVEPQPASLRLLRRYF